MRRSGRPRLAALRRDRVQRLPGAARMTALLLLSIEVLVHCRTCHRLAVLWIRQVDVVAGLLKIVNSFVFIFVSLRRVAEVLACAAGLDPVGRRAFLVAHGRLALQLLQLVVVLRHAELL